MPYAVAAAAAVGIAGAVIGSSAAGSAAKDQENAANNATATQLQMFEQSQADLQPYNAAGQAQLTQMGATGSAALSQLASLYGVGTGGPSAATNATDLTALENTPGYQFTLGQGVKAIDAGGAATGTLQSGNTGTALEQYGQGLAQSNAWTPYINQLSQLAGLSTTVASLGENAAAGQGNNAIQTGANVGASQEAAGTAAASGAVGSANAITGSTGSAVTNGLLLYGLSNPSTQTSYTQPQGGLTAGGFLPTN